jgi:hypothetical protein
LSKNVNFFDENIYQIITFVPDLATHLIVVEFELPERGQHRQVLDLLDQVPAEAQRLHLPQPFQVLDLADPAVVLQSIK